MKTRKEKFDLLAEHIEKQVKELHEEFHKGSWNPLCGQWLVYGFERNLGFSGAVGLEAAIERAHRKNKDIKQTALDFFLTEFPAKA